MMINRNKLLKDSESFKNVEKDLAYIVSKIAQDDKLLKLLCLKEKQSEPLTEQEKKEVLKECVNIVPIITEDIMSDKGWSDITIQFSQFVKNGDNPEHRDKFLVFNIICNLDTVNMQDFKLRPYQIAGRLDALFDKKALCGSYSIDFLTAETIAYDEDTLGVSLIYSVTYFNSADRNDEE